jgi:hypothetical protein
MTQTGSRVPSCGATAVRDDTVGLGTSIQRNNLSPYRGAPIRLVWKITMSSWLISPWEAARLSMEVQRVIALQFFGFVFPKTQPTREQRASDEEQASLPRQDPSIASSVAVLTRSKRIQPAQKRTVATRSNTQMTKKATGNRKRKSRTHKGKR